MNHWLTILTQKISIACTQQYKTKTFLHHIPSIIHEQQQQKTYEPFFLRSIYVSFLVLDKKMLRSKTLWE